MNDLENIFRVILMENGIRITVSNEREERHSSSLVLYVKGVLFFGLELNGV